MRNDKGSPSGRRKIIADDNIDFETKSTINDNNTWLRFFSNYSNLFKRWLREFPGGPLVRTQCSHCQGPRFDSWSWN